MLLWRQDFFFLDETFNSLIQPLLLQTENSAAHRSGARPPRLPIRQSQTQPGATLNAVHFIYPTPYSLSVLPFMAFKGCKRNELSELLTKK